MWVNQIRPLLQSDDIYHQLLCTPQTHTLKNNWYPSFIDGAHPLNVFTISYSTQPCILKSMVKFNISLVLQLTWTDNHMTASASRRCSLCFLQCCHTFQLSENWWLPLMWLITVSHIWEEYWVSSVPSSADLSHGKKYEERSLWSETFPQTVSPLYRP